jgi:hypothetical protein
MKLSTIFTSLGLLVTAVTASAAADGLIVETLFKPEECLLKSQNGDKLSMQSVYLLL